MCLVINISFKSYPNIFTNGQAYIKRAMDVLFFEYDDFALRYMSNTFQHCNMDFSPLPLISKDLAKNIKTPITLFAAEKDIIFTGKKMIKRAAQILPSLEEAVLLEGSKHVPNASDFKKIESSIIDKV